LLTVRFTRYSWNATAMNTTPRPAMSMVSTVAWPRCPRHPAARASVDNVPPLVGEVVVDGAANGGLRREQERHRAAERHELHAVLRLAFLDVAPRRLGVRRRDHPGDGRIPEQAEGVVDRTRGRRLDDPHERDVEVALAPPLDVV